MKRRVVLSIAFTSVLIIATTANSLGATKRGTNISVGKLLWSQEFNAKSGTAPDGSVWTPLIDDGAAQLGFSQYGTGELELNKEGAAREDGAGHLVLSTAKSGGVWTSSRLWTQGKVNFLYGDLQARIKLPTGVFNWPALWMLGSNYQFPNLQSGSVPWPNSGEIDIMEGLNNNSVIKATLHANLFGTHTDWGSDGYGISVDAPLQDISSSYHIFGVLWTPNSLSFTLDGKIYGSDTYSHGVVTVRNVGAATQKISSKGVWPFNLSEFLIIDNAIPSWAPTMPDGTSSSMDVDWIRYYKYDGYGSVSYGAKGHTD